MCITSTVTLSIRLVIRSLIPLAHPMHLHGHNFWVVAEGTGEWNGTVTRPWNPQRRDTHILQGGLPTKDGVKYAVIDFLADNPGIWPFHCHVAWHVSDGLYLNIMVSSHTQAGSSKLDLQLTM